MCFLGISNASGFCHNDILQIGYRIEKKLIIESVLSELLTKVLESDPPQKDHFLNVRTAQAIE